MLFQSGAGTFLLRGCHSYFYSVRTVDSVPGIYKECIRTCSYTGKLGYCCGNYLPLLLGSNPHVQASSDDFQASSQQTLYLGGQENSSDYIGGPYI